jgi:peptide/nickel transport system substrate-binding protein
MQLESNRGVRSGRRHAGGVAAGLVLAAAAGLGPLVVQAEPSGTLTVAVIQENQSMQAQMTFKEVNAVGLRNVIEQLTTINPVTGALEPMLATSWEPVDEHTWRFHLRQSVTFHDGSPFDAESAAFLVNWVWDPANRFGIREANAGQPITAEVVDEHTIDVRNSRGPDPILPYRLYLSGITSMQQIQDDIAQVDRVPIGTGPYRFVEWVTGQHWEAEVNPDWWGAGAEGPPGVHGRQLFERLRFVFRPEEAVRAAMLRSGEVDIAMFLAPDQCEQAEADAATSCLLVDSDTYIWMRPDMRGAHPALNDVRVREALYVAVDMPAIVEHIIVQGTFLNGQMLPEAAVGHVPDLEPYAYDPDRARQLLDAARADGVDVDGLTVHLATRVGSSPRNGEVIEAIANYLGQVGISTTVAVEEPAVFNQWLIADADATRANIAVHPANFGIMDYELTLGAGYTCDSQLSVYCNPDFDARLNAAARLSGEERHKALQDLVRFVRDEMVMAPVALMQRAYGMPAGLGWEPGLDHRVQVINMTRD